MSKPKVYVVGVGMTPFTKPGSTGKDYPELVKDAVTDALNDCGLQYKDVQQATVGYLYGGTCCGQRALYEVGFTGIPIYNVNNACASGSSGVYLCKQIIEGGNADVCLAVGFEKMAPGSLEKMQPLMEDRTFSTEKHIQVMNDTYGIGPTPILCQMFGHAGKEHMEKYGTKREHFAKIGWKNHLHSVNNPKSQFQKYYPLEEVLKARSMHECLGLLECSPTSDGSAAAVLVSERWLAKNPHLREQAVEIVGMELATDEPSVFAENSNLKMTGFDMAKKAADRLYQKTGKNPNDVQVIELHDCFASNELVTYEAIGLCPVGKGGEIVDRGDNTYGGKWVINPSGGLISKGHPIGATGVAQIVELSNQLRGRCGKRQVPKVKLAMQHNLGIGGAVVVGLYQRADGGVSPGQGTLSLAGLGVEGVGGGAGGNSGGSGSNSEFKSDVIFEEIKSRAGEEPELAKQVKGSFRFTITADSGNKKSWTVDMKKATPYIGTDSQDKTDVEILVKDSDFILISQGKLKPDQAFMSGKMKIKGNIMMAMKLKAILDPSKLKSKL